MLNNAFRFANNGVKLTIMETVGYLEFVIQDDGPGFSKKDLENATTLFYSSQTNKGSFGIGLSISKILCEKHGGILKLLNNENGACAIERWNSYLIIVFSKNNFANYLYW